MTDQLLAELRKMRSTRTNLGLLVGMVGLILLTVLLTGFISKKPELADVENQYAVLSAGTSAALFAALIGVMAITGEFRHGTIRPTFVVTPHRSRVIVAKVLSSLLMGVLFGLAAIALSFGIGYAVLAVRDIPLALSTGDVLWLVLGTPVLTAGWAALGVGFGAILRNQVFAVIGLIVWAMIIDNLIRGLVPTVGGYTPVGASAAIIADPADYVLSAAAGGLLLFGYVAVFVAAGALLVAHRDVT
jgi:ABC-type transport system involved in multi-copper enzyme maturation permease subunit